MTDQELFLWIALPFFIALPYVGIWLIERSGRTK